METIKLLAAIPPLLVWFVLFAYLNKVDKRVQSLEKDVETLRRP